MNKIQSLHSKNYSLMGDAKYKVINTKINKQRANEIHGENNYSCMRVYQINCPRRYYL